jgi:hypothetical protein
MSTPIYVGGWARFREECDVTKKEAAEDFSWMGRRPSEFHSWRWTMNDASDYEECREALDKVEGAREYLKTYVAVEEGEGFDFRDPIGEQIVLGSHHSGASYAALVWDYHHLLKDWDGWVLRRKERRAFEEYQKIQVKPMVITGLYYPCKEFIEGNKGHFPVVESELLARAAAVQLHGSVQEIYSVLCHLFTEHMAHLALQAEKEEKRRHRELIGGLKWKYKHPSRWFDTPWGSSLFPTTPQNITEEAFVEMEALYPGYRHHIQQVDTALRTFQLPQRVTRYSQAGEEYTKNHLQSFQIPV